MGSDKLRVESNERVDISDFRFLAGEMSENHVKQLAESVLSDPSKTQLWIIRGFGIDNPSANEIRVSKGATGAAILARRDSGIVRYGAIATEGDDTKTIDINSYTNGTYNIYIRFEYTPGDSASRIFWNSAGSGSEYAQTINTRELATWNLAIENASPGAEWYKIGEVVKSGGAPVITDQRRFYFEGEVHNSYQSGWSTDGGGSANDRNADRQQYGVFDFQSAFAALRQCVEDVKGRGLKAWYSRDIGGMNIGFDADPTSGQLAVGDATYYLSKETDDPTMTFDSNDYMQFDRSENELKFVLASSSVAEIHEEGLIIPTGGVCVGFAGTPTADRIQIGDANFELRSSLILWDANDYISYVRGSDEWQFYINGTGDVFTLNATDATFAVDISVTGDVQADTLTISDTAGEGVTDNLVPTSNDSLDLGNATYGWRDTYSRTLHLEGATTTEPHVELLHTGAIANEEKWHIKSFSTGNFQIMALSDDELTASNALYFTRSTTTVDSAVFPISEVEIDHTLPKFTFYENDADTNRKRMQLRHTGNYFSIGGVNDSSAYLEHLRFVKDTVDSPGGPYGLQYKGNYLAIQDSQISSDIGLASHLCYTGQSSVPSGSNTKTITNANTAETSAGFIKIYVGVNTRYIPYFNNT